MKHTPCDHQRRAGEPSTSDSYGVAFATRREMFCSFTALSSIRRMAVGDRETVTAAGR